MFCIQLLVAGNETTRNLISGGLWALAEHPDQVAHLRDDPALVPRAVEELLRWTTPVTSFLRTATRDTTLAGQPIAEGEPVQLLYASANRDEAAFGPTAGELDVGRDPQPPGRVRLRRALLPGRRPGPPGGPHRARGGPGPLVEHRARR